MNAAMLLAIFGECCNRSVQISADVYCDNSSNKEANGWPHLTSWHSWLGMAAIVGWIVLDIVGAVALHPE
jgi:hypothetical protein